MPRSDLSVVPFTAISCNEFQQRLTFALENYVQYCKVMGVIGSHAPIAEWIDHFQDFISMDELVKRVK